MAARVVVADSITKLPERGLDAVIVAASHGGVYSAALAAAEHPRGVVFSDAGIALDESGVSGLAWLDALGCPACAVSVASARIGWGRDMMERGVLSRVNAAAARLGCHAGQACAEAVRQLASAPPWTGEVPAVEDARMLLQESPIRVIGLDSISLVSPADADAVVVSGSHGGLLGGRPEFALAHATAGAIYHDAGGGLEGAGMTRLPALDARGVPAATVAGMSARIGDARSVWATGRLSAVNALARALGIHAGQTPQEFAAAVAAARHMKHEQGARRA